MIRKRSFWKHVLFYSGLLFVAILGLWAIGTVVIHYGIVLIDVIKNAPDWVKALGIVWFCCFVMGFFLAVTTYDDKYYS